jgi:tetratricopeptide (TPR) repeat protein
MVSRDFTPAVAELSDAIDLNPSFAFAHVILASTYGYGGLPEDGLHHIAIADRLSPRDFTQAANLATAGMCHFIAGRYAQGLELEKRAVALRPHFIPAWRTLTACAGMADDRDTATRALAQVMRLQPALTLDWVEMYHSIVQPEDRARYVEGLRRAGLR